MIHKEKYSHINVGDTVSVHYKVVEGNKTRIQPYKGIIIAMKSSGIARTFTCRRIGANSVGVERIFPFSSPNIMDIKVEKQGVVRRAKLYYLRDRVGKAAERVKEVKRVSKKAVA